MKEEDKKQETGEVEKEEDKKLQEAKTEHIKNDDNFLSAIKRIVGG